MHRFPPRRMTRVGRAAQAGDAQIAARQAGKQPAGPPGVPLPPNAQTKPDRTRREQGSEMERSEVTKKSPEIR
jgi:hypothetical protein